MFHSFLISCCSELLDLSKSMTTPICNSANYKLDGSVPGKYIYARLIIQIIIEINTQMQYQEIKNM